MAIIPSINSDSVLIVLGLIIFVLGRRIIRQRKGVVYSVRSIFMIPVIYVLLTAFFLIGTPIWQDIVIILMVSLGVIVGLILGKRSDIFEKNGKILYRRSNEITAIWIIGYIIRISVDFFVQTGIFIFYANILLGISAGLLLGEAFVLYTNHNLRYLKK